MLRWIGNSLAFIGLATLGLIGVPPAAKAQDITTGLVSYWKLDESSGSTAIDSSTQGNDGTFSGTYDPATDSVSGKMGKAANFGVDPNAFFTAPFLAALKTSKQITISTWVNMKADANEAPMTGIVEISDFAVFRKGHFNKQLMFFASAWDTTAGDWRGPPIPDGGWTHIVVTYSYDDPVGTAPKFYVNGQSSGAPIVAGHPAGSYVAPVAANIHVSRRWDSTGSAFRGAMDEVRIYNRVLTPEEIDYLYHAWTGHLRYNTSHRVPEYYNGSNWIAAGPTPYVPEAVAFDGITDWLVRGSNLTGVADTKKETGSFWVRRNRSGILEVVTITGFGHSLVRFLANDTLQIAGRDGTNTLIISLLSSTPVNDTGWHHVLFSYDLGTPGAFHLYTDDTDVANSSTFTDALINLTAGNNFSVAANSTGNDKFFGGLADIWIEYGTYIDLSVEANRRKFIDVNGDPVDLGADGNRPTGSAPDIFLSGSTDDWHTNKGTGGGFTENGELTDSVTEPGGPYAHVPMDGLVGWWRLDEAWGSDVIDYASASNGTFSSGGSATDVQPVSGVFGTALAFDGREDRIGISATDDIENIFDGGGTVAFWVYPKKELPGEILPMFLSKDDWSLNRRDGFAGETGIEVRVNFSTTDGVWRAETTSPAIAYDKWNHVVIIYNADSASNDPTLYVNGIVGVLGEIVTPAGTRSSDAGEPLYIGDNPANTTSNHGYFDEIMLWNRALDPSDVAALYEAGVCANPEHMNGSVIYNATHNVLQYCDGPYPGNGWKAMGPHPGPGGAGCSNPSYPEGMVMYNTTYNVLQYCDGVNWRALREPAVADPCASSPSPGDVCADGSVYAGLSPDGNVAMYTPPADAGQFAWNNGNSGGYMATGQTSATTGDANTTALIGLDSDSGVAGTQPHQAAQACADLSAHGQSDWYLPAKNELAVLYTNSVAIGGFDTGAFYWSSSEDTVDLASRQYFGDGSNTSKGKFTALSVRCVRR